MNRNTTTDFAAPAFNVPTFSRTYGAAATSGGTGGTGGTGGGGTGGGTASTGTGTGSTTTGGAFISNPMVFSMVGTSMSSAIVTGSYALVSSALNYWTGLAQSNGYTADAYLNTPVGTDTLNFGKHAFKNLGAWNTPDGINGILAWTAVPATDYNDINTVSTPYQLPNSTAYPSYARVSVSNAVASIEGTEAINFLNKHHDWSYIDTNHDGLITAQELQTFSDNAASMGMPEAGAMAALLGGTATYGPVLAGVNNTVFNENPDQPGAEQRRFNYFDYAADGQLNGSISINELKMLGHTLLPSPDAYTIVDRQRAAANGFLLAPSTPRNFVAIKNLSPSFLWVPKSTVARYRNISPAQFTVGRGEKGGSYLPFFALFNPTIVVSANSSSTNNQVVGLTKSANVGGSKVTVDYVVNACESHAHDHADTDAHVVGKQRIDDRHGYVQHRVVLRIDPDDQLHARTAPVPPRRPTASGTGTTSSSTSQGTGTTSTPSPSSTLPTVVSTLMPAGTETPTTSSSSAGTGTTTPATSSSGSAGTGATSTATSSSGSTGTEADAPVRDHRPDAVADHDRTPTPMRRPRRRRPRHPPPHRRRRAAWHVAPAPLAYSSGPTIAVSPSTTTTAQAQKPPKAETRGRAAFTPPPHKKQSSLDKFWSSVKKSLASSNGTRPRHRESGRKEPAGPGQSGSRPARLSSRPPPGGGSSPGDRWNLDGPPRILRVARRIASDDGVSSARMTYREPASCNRLPEGPSSRPRRPPPPPSWRPIAPRHRSPTGPRQHAGGRRSCSAA